MKSAMLGFLFFCSFTLSLGAQPMQVAVSDFDVKGKVEKDAGSIIADALGVALQKSGRFALIERSQLAKILKEQELSISSLMDQATLAKVGKLSGVQTLVLGSVVELGGSYAANARLVKTDTGEVVETGLIRGNSLKELQGKIDSLMLQLQGQKSTDFVNAGMSAEESAKYNKFLLPIIRVTGNPPAEAVLGAGYNLGVRKGDRYLIMVPKYEISKITGKSTNMGNEKVGFMVVDYVEPGLSSAKITLSVNDPDRIAQINKEGIGQFTLGKVSDISFELGAGFVVSYSPLSTGGIVTFSPKLDMGPVFISGNFTVDAVKAGIGGATGKLMDEDWIWLGGSMGIFVLKDDLGGSGAIEIGVNYLPMVGKAESGWGTSREVDDVILNLPITYTSDLYGFIFKTGFYGSYYNKTSGGSTSGAIGGGMILNFGFRF